MTFEIVPLFTTLLTLSLKAAVLVAAILFVRKLIGARLSPAWRHALWGLVPLQLLFCVSIPSPWSVQNLWTGEAEPVVMASAKNNITIPLSPFRGGGLGWGGEQPEDSYTPHPNPLPRERGMPNDRIDASGFFVSLPSPLLITVGVWFVGVVAMALVFLRQTLLCRCWMREAEQVESEAVLRLFKECAKRMKVRTWLVIAESRSVSGPLLIGAIRPTLLLPHGLVESATPQQLRTVLLHELAHLKRWDIWTGWLMTVLLTLHWFNPLLWLAVRKMNADREEAADELALRTMDPVERPDYGRALIDIAQHFVTPTRTPGLVGISETGKNLTRRIEMLTHTGTWKLRWKILALLAVLLLGVTTMTDAQTRSPAEIQADIDRLQTELKEAKKAEKTVLPLPPSERTVTESLKLYQTDERMPKNFPLLKFLGNYTGTEGDDPIGFQFNLMAVPKGTPDFDRLDGKEIVPHNDGETFKFSDSLMVHIHEGGLPQDKNKMQDDSYMGKLYYVGPNELELRVEKYFDDGKKEKPIPKALRSVPIKVIGEGENMVLEIPKNAEWDKIRLKRVKIFALTASVAPTGMIAPKDALPGSYLGWEGDDQFGIVIGKAGTDPFGNTYPVTMYEDGLPGQGFDPNDDDRYEGTATLKDGKLEITLAKKFDENVEEPVEKALRKLSATLGSENGKTTLSIPKNREWDAVRVTKVTE